MRSYIDEMPSAINQCHTLIFLVMSSENVDMHLSVETYTYGTGTCTCTHLTSTPLLMQTYIKDM